MTFSIQGLTPLAKWVAQHGVPADVQMACEVGTELTFFTPQSFSAEELMAITLVHELFGHYDSLSATIAGAQNQPHSDLDAFLTAFIYDHPEEGSTFYTPESIPPTVRESVFRDAIGRASTASIRVVHEADLSSGSPIWDAIKDRNLFPWAWVTDVMYRPEHLEYLTDILEMSADDVVTSLDKAGFTTWHPAEHWADVSETEELIIDIVRGHETHPDRR